MHPDIYCNKSVATFGRYKHESGDPEDPKSLVSIAFFADKTGRKMTIGKKRFRLWFSGNAPQRFQKE
jgi:hypothetical protein